MYWFFRNNNNLLLLEIINVHKLCCLHIICYKWTWNKHNKCSLKVIWRFQRSFNVKHAFGESGIFVHCRILWVTCIFWIRKLINEIGPCFVCLLVTSQSCCKGGQALGTAQHFFIQQFLLLIWSQRFALGKLSCTIRFLGCKKNVQITFNLLFSLGHKCL